MEERYQNNVAVQVPRVLLPKKGADYYKRAVVACDQYTSQPAYWEDVAGRFSGWWVKHKEAEPDADPEREVDKK